MKLFPRYVPSVEEEARERKDRAYHIGTDLFAFAIVIAVVCTGILCGGHGRFSYDYYPHMRGFDVLTSCIGLGWAVVLTLFRFIMKPATRRKLTVMYILDVLTGLLLVAYFLAGAYLAHIGRFPDIPFTFTSVLHEALMSMGFMVYFPVFHLIYYRQSKIDLIDKTDAS